MSFANDVTDLIASAVERLIGGDARGAVDSLRAIDQARLLAERQDRRSLAESVRSRGARHDTPDERAPGVRSAVQERVMARDRYICCYCGRRTAFQD